MVRTYKTVSTSSKGHICKISHCAETKYYFASIEDEKGNIVYQFSGSGMTSDMITYQYAKERLIEYLERQV